MKCIALLLPFQIATVDGAKVIKADQMATNGVIHVVNRVMFPIPMGSVVDVVVKDAHFSTLLKAVQTAKLATTLSGILQHPFFINIFTQSTNLGR